MALTYNPEIFSVLNLSQAKNIILTAESSTTEERWKTGTPMLSALISANNKIGPETVVNGPVGVLKPRCTMAADHITFEP